MLETVGDPVEGDKPGRVDRLYGLHKAKMEPNQFLKTSLKALERPCSIAATYCFSLRNCLWIFMYVHLEIFYRLV